MYIRVFQFTIRNIEVYIAFFFNSKGWINTTIMFYSSYPATTLVSDDGDTTYKLPLAYLLVGAAYLILSLLLMVSRYV